WSRERMRDGVQGALAALEAEGCAAILLLCTGTFEGLACDKAWLIEPDHIIPGMVAGLVEKRQLGVIVPIASQIGSESGKWRGLHRPPIFAAASPYGGTEDALVDAGKELKARGADAILLDCIGFTERHRRSDRQDDHRRGLARHPRREPVLRHAAEPARPRPCTGRLLLGLGGGGRGWVVRHRARHRYRRFGARAGELLRALRHPADAW